jgi:hypothetical protein
MRRGAGGIVPPAPRRASARPAQLPPSGRRGFAVRPVLPELDEPALADPELEEPRAEPDELLEPDELASRLGRGLAPPSLLPERRV